MKVYISRHVLKKWQKLQTSHATQIRAQMEERALKRTKQQISTCANACQVTRARIVLASRVHARRRNAVTMPIAWKRAQRQYAYAKTGISKRTTYVWTWTNALFTVHATQQRFVTILRVHTVAYANRVTQATANFANSQQNAQAVG
jgi:mRNA-degrading endonuclease RelE of RelBE toxin-antitoxin system